LAYALVGCNAALPARLMRGPASRAGRQLEGFRLRPSLVATVAAASLPQLFRGGGLRPFAVWATLSPQQQLRQPLWQARPVQLPPAAAGGAGAWRTVAVLCTAAQGSMSSAGGPTGTAETAAMAATATQAGSAAQADPHDNAAAIAARAAAQAGDSGPTTNKQDLKEAAALRSDASAAGAATTMDTALAKLPGVVIDEGTFKYVLMKVFAASGEHRYMVRGTAGAAYHKDVALPYVRKYLADGFKVEILGGGRILHQPEEKKIMIYGFSYGFPWVDGAGHAISADVCREAYPDYSVDWSDEGY